MTKSHAPKFTNSNKSFIATASAVGLILLSPSAHAEDHSALTGLSAMASIAAETLTLPNTQNDQFVPSKHIEDNAQSTTQYQHFYKGVEVIGSVILKHKSTNKALRLNHPTSDFKKSFDLDTRAQLTEEQAFALARAHTGQEINLEEGPSLKILPRGDEQAAQLIYRVSTLPSVDGEEGHEVFIDAHSGQVIAVTGEHLHIAPRAINVAVYEATQKCQTVEEDSPTGFPKTILVTQCKPSTARSNLIPTADESARRAFYNSQRVLDYYWDTHRRSSYDGRNGAVTHVVHVGKNMSNAFWDTRLKLMAYGDGNPTRGTQDFTHALDVAGHEMTHGVVSQTAGFLHFGEAGALNEAFADIFGKFIARDGDWIMGKEVYANNRTSPNGIRNLENPGLKPAQYRENGQIIRGRYPSKTSEMFKTRSRCDSDNDSCFVHINSTVVGHGAYKTVLAIGPQKAEKLFYLTLTQYLLNPAATFNQMARATGRACDALYDRTTCAKVDVAFAGVGLATR